MKSVLLRNEYRLTIGWFLATAIGFVVGKVFLNSLAFRVIPLSLVNSRFDWLVIILRLTTGITIGLSIGILQWLILRNYLTPNWAWIPATFLGITIGYLIEGFLWVTARYYVSIYAVPEFWSIIYWVILFAKGLVIGSSQWIILRKLLPKSWIWVIANAFAWALALIIGEDVIRPIFYPCCFDYIFSPIFESIIYGVVGILIGIITGVLLLWLLRQNALVVHNTA